MIDRRTSAGSFLIAAALLCSCLGVENDDPSVATQSVSGAMTCNLKSDTNVYSIPSVTKPGYLLSFTEPTFGTRITRITGDPGTAIATGGTWGSDVHHQYSKIQAWNADQSLIFIENNREGGTGSVFLDGSTYQPVFSRSCPGSECRWHPSDPTLMVYASGNQIGYWYPRTNTKTVLASFSGYSGLLIGPWEGNLSLDGRRIVVSGTGPSGNVAFAYDLVSKTKYPDIRISAFGTTLDWASISPLGNYVVVQVDNDLSFVTDLNGARVTSFAQGHPSHYDMTLDQNGDEIAVGKAVSSPHSGKVIKVRLKDGAMTPLTTGGYARHSSTRDTAARSWGVSSMEPTTSYPPYNAEIDLYNVDGSVVYRLAHHRGRYTDYESEVIPTISPDGMRVMFASNFGASTGRPMQVYVIDLRNVCTTSSDTTAPTVPTGLAASAISTSQINLSWNASTDNVGVSGYKVFRDSVAIGSVSSTSFSDSGLAASSTHSYAVRAFDAAGNQSAQSATVAATTLAASSTTTFHLDFGTGSSGTGSSAIAPGYTGVPLIAFSSTLGYGWQSISGMDTRDRPSSSNPLQRDFHKTWDSHFLVNVANGNYAVTVYLGDNDNDLTNMYVSAQGVNVVNARSTSSTGRLIQASFTTQVSTGKLDLRFYTTNSTSVYYGYIAVNGIDVTPM